MNGKVQLKLPRDYKIPEPVLDAAESNTDFQNEARVPNMDFSERG